MVADLRHINKAIKRVGYPMDSSFHILRRLEPEDAALVSLTLYRAFTIYLWLRRAVICFL